MAFIAIMLSSCITIRVREIAKEPMPLEPEIYLFTSNDSALALVKFTAPETDIELSEFVYELTVTEVSIIHKGNVLFKELRLKPIDMPSRKNNLSGNAVFCQYGLIPAIPGVNWSEIEFEFSFIKTIKTYNLKKDYQSIIRNTSNDNKNDCIFLLPYCKTSGRTVEFGATAIRLCSEPDEYLPTSENFRAEIISPKREKAWSSNDGINHLQVISQVEPAKFGDVKKFNYKWDGKNKASGDAIAGTYSITMTIPSQPRQYTAFITFNRTGK